MLHLCDTHLIVCADAIICGTLHNRIGMQSRVLVTLRVTAVAALLLFTEVAAQGFCPSIAWQRCTLALLELAYNQRLITAAAAAALCSLHACFAL